MILQQTGTPFLVEVIGLQNEIVYTREYKTFGRALQFIERHNKHSVFVARLKGYQHG